MQGGRRVVFAVDGCSLSAAIFNNQLWFTTKNTTETYSCFHTGNPRDWKPANERGWTVNSLWCKTDMSWLAFQVRGSAIVWQLVHSMLSSWKENKVSRRIGNTTTTTVTKKMAWTASYIPCSELALLGHSMNRAKSTIYMPWCTRKRNHWVMRYLTLESKLFSKAKKKAEAQEYGTISLSRWNGIQSDWSHFRWEMRCI